MLSGLGSVDHAQVIPVEVEQSLTASVGPQQTAALREALGALPDSALTFAQMLAEVRKLVELAGGAERLALARRQGAALREVLGVRPDTAFDTLIAEVESLVDAARHAQVTFEIPDAPTLDVRTVWGFNGNTGDAERWTRDPQSVTRCWSPTGKVLDLERSAPLTWFELINHYGTLTSKDPNA